MSYDIVYNRQFIRAGDKFIPLVLIGSNNLWENTFNGNNTQRRVRNWNPLMNCCNAIPLMTADEIMAKAESWTGGEYQEHFMRNSKWVDDKALLAFFKNGIKSAATLEELQERSTYPDDVYLKCYLSIWYKDENGEQKHKSELFQTVRNTESLLAYMDIAWQRYLDRQSNENSVYICVEFPNEKVIPYPKERTIRRKPERLESDFWVIFVKRSKGADYYVQKLASKSLYFAYTADYAKQFKTQAAAEKWAADRLIQKRFADIDSLEYRHVA